MRFPSSKRFPIHRYHNGRHLKARDTIAIEEPLEIRIQLQQAETPLTHNIATTMRTPGHDYELSAGFLFSEGLLSSPDGIKTFDYCVGTDKSKQHYNVLTISLRPDVEVPIDKWLRPLTIHSSCGVCGKSSIEDLTIRANYPLNNQTPNIAHSTLLSLSQTLHTQQVVFQKTGGLHSAGLFGPQGDLLSLFEDIGRHNAVDKVIGKQFLDRNLPLQNHLLLVSGRISFEIVQKARMAGISCLAAISAPSSLAIETADTLGMTLIGFLREDQYNIYTHPQRITAEIS